MRKKGSKYDLGICIDSEIIIIRLIDFYCPSEVLLPLEDDKLDEAFLLTRHRSMPRRTRSVYSERPTKELDREEVSFPDLPTTSLASVIRVHGPLSIGSSLPSR